MPCRIYIKEQLEDKVKRETIDMRNMSYRNALNAARAYNAKTGYKVIEVYSDQDVGTVRSINIPTEFVDFWYQKEEIFENEQQAREIQMEDALRAGIKEEQFTDRYLFDESVQEELDSSYIDTVEQIAQQFSLTREEQKADRDLEIATKLAEKFKKSFDIDYQIVNESEAKVLLEKSPVPYDGEGAFYYQNKVFFVEGNFNSDTVLHEYAHPFIKAIQKDNRALFDKLYYSLGGTTEGSSIIEQLTKKAEEKGNLDYIGSDRFKEEAIVRSIELDGNRKLNKIKSDDVGFKKFIKDLMYAIRQVLRKFAKKLNLKALNTNTKVDQLTDMLLGDDFVIDTSILEASDFPEFRDQQLDMIEEFKKVEASKFIKAINDFDSLAEQQLSDFRRTPGKLKESLKGKEGEILLKNLKDFLGDINTKDMSKIQEDKLLDAIANRQKEFTARAGAIISSVEHISIFVAQIDNILKSMESNQEYLEAEGNAKLHYYTTILEQQKAFLGKSLLPTLNLYPTTEVSKKIQAVKGSIDTALDTIQKYQFDYIKEYLAEGSEYMNSNIVADFTNNDVKLIFEASGLSQDDVNNFVNKVVNRANKGPITKYNMNDLKNDLGGKEINPGQVKYLFKAIQNFSSNYVSKEKLDTVLKGEGGDIGKVAANLNAYTQINDPVIGSFVMQTKKFLSDAAMESQEQYNTVMNRLVPLLNQVGYNPNDTTQLQDLLYFVDKVAVVNKEGILEEKEVYTLLNKFKDWRKDYKQLTHAREQAVEQGDQQAIRQAKAELEEFEEKYMHRQYTQEFYDVQKIWRSNVEVTNPVTKEGMLVDRELSEEAYEERNTALSNLNAARKNKYMTEDETNPVSELDEAEREYKELYNLVDDQGNYKKGDDLKKTLVRLKHREESNKFYTGDTDLDAIQRDLNTFVNVQLKGKGITDSKEIERLIAEEFGNENMVEAKSQLYFDEQKRLNDQIKQLTEKGGVSDVARRLAELYRLRGLQLSVVSTLGVPDGTALTQGQIQKLKKTEEEIAKVQEEYDSQTGLTKDEIAILENYEDIIAREGKLASAEQQKEYVRLSTVKNNLGLTTTEQIRLRKLFKEKAQLTNKKATSEYMDIMNSLVGSGIANLDYEGKLDDKDLKKITFENADDFINNPVIEKLRDNPAFSNWFDQNHYKKTIRGKEQYVRLSSWTSSTPSQLKYYETTTLINPDTNQEIVLPGKPNSKYFRRRVKDQYRTIPFGLTDKEKQKYVGTIIDNKGNYLPREYKGTDPTGAYDAKYKNQEYYDLEQQDNTRFKLLKAVTEEFLKLQENKAYSSKLYLDQPRFRKRGTLEYVQSGKVGKKSAAIWSWAKSQFKKSVDDADSDPEYGFDFDPTIHVVQTDVSGQPISRVPIQGLYGLDASDVSGDVLGGISTYLYSLNEQQALIENEPMMKTVEGILKNEDNAIKDMAKSSAFMNRITGSMSFIDKGRRGTKENNRAEALRYWMEKVWYNQINSEWIEKNPGKTKLARFLMGAASRSFIAGDLQSATKNRFGMTLQKFLEASGGNLITYSSMARGKLLAGKATMEMSSSEIYKVGSKGYLAQLMEGFDAVPGKFKKDFGRSSSRTFIKDALEGSFLYDARRLMEVNAAQELFFALTENHLVKQKQPDGEVKEIYLTKAYELDSKGQIKLKDGVDIEYSMKPIKHTIVAEDTLSTIADTYGITVEELKQKNKTIKSDEDLKNGKEITISKASKFKDFKFRVASVNMRLNGNMSSIDNAQANKYLGYNLFSFYRKFALPMFMERFQASEKEDNKYGEVYDWNAGNTKKGIYISAFQSMRNLLTDYKNYKELMTPKEIGAMKKTLAEIGSILALAMAAIFIFGYEDDDPDRFKKLEERQKTWGGWLANQALYMTIMTRRENEMFNPLLGYQEMFDLVSNTTIATGPTIDLYLKMLNDMIYIISGNDKAVYKSDVGPYPWQEEGSYKLWHHFFSIFGLKGKNVNPIKAIKDQESFRNLR